MRLDFLRPCTRAPATRLAGRGWPVHKTSDAGRDRTWKRILAAAKRYDVEVSESSWRDLAKGGKDRGR